MSPLLIVLAALQVASGSRDVPFDEQRSTEVRLAVADGTHHDTCVVTFPEDALEAIVASWNESDLSIERRRGNLFIKLLRKVEGDVQVVGASGTMYRLHLRPVDAEPDRHVRILRPAREKREAITSLELVQAMRRGEAPEWASVRTMEETLFRDDRSEYVGRYVYEAATYVGYVVEVKNLSRVRLRLDPSRYAAKDLILVGSREMTVEPEKTTLVYLVFWR